jgi:hypothetical protein
MPPEKQSEPYGYQSCEGEEDFSFPMLSRKESLLLRLAEIHLGNLLPDSLKKVMSDSFRQARYNLCTAGYVIPEHEWLDKVCVVSTTQALLAPTIQPGVFEAVSDALFDNYCLRMDYTNAQGKTKQIEVMPLGLAQQGARLYLVCRYSNGKQDSDGKQCFYADDRLLALNRMELPWDYSEELPAVLKTKPFKRPPEFNLKQYDADGGFGFGEGKQIKLIFHIDQAAGYHLKESKLSEDQEVTDIGNNQYEISATVVETELLKSWLRGFGKQITHVKMTYCAIPL